MSENAPNEEKVRGRPKNAYKTRSTKERTRALAQAEVKPLDVLMLTMAKRWKTAQGMPEGEERAKMEQEACVVAEKVAPYLHPKLQATTIKGDADQPLSFTVSLPASEALRAMIRGTDK